MDRDITNSLIRTKNCPKMKLPSQSYLLRVAVNDRTASSRQLAARWSTTTGDNDGRIRVRRYAGESCLPESELSNDIVVQHLEFGVQFRIMDDPICYELKVISLATGWRSWFDAGLVRLKLRVPSRPKSGDYHAAESRQLSCVSSTASDEVARQHQQMVSALPTITKHPGAPDGDRFNSCQVIYSQFGLAIHRNDHQARRRFLEWAQNEIAVVPDFHKRILFSDEAHFWLNGYVNKQNCRIWSEANPQVYVETPLHPEKLTVWCALWAGGILLQKR
ncbi:hypothetical protein TNCV_888511 [Trichonephila clavipes]|nr:hypothetical protein TNCV_888511 [Trichonephila clavipes]